MELEELISHFIYNYPTLYRGNNHKESRIPILGHIFLSYGTALEWHPDGFLTYLNYDKKGKSNYVTTLRPKKLPKGFYEKELWMIIINDKKKLKECLNELKGIFHYKRISSFEINIVLEGNKDFANEIAAKYSSDSYAREAQSYYRETSSYRKLLMKKNSLIYEYGKYTPSGMCKYSPIVEMINKKTNSCHIDNFDLNVRQDWISGALDIAEYSLDFYKDDEKNKYNMYNPINSLKGFEDNYKSNPTKYRNDRLEDGMKPEHTIEQWCNLVWQKHLNEQIGYLEKFIKLYK